MGLCVVECDSAIAYDSDMACLFDCGCDSDCALACRSEGPHTKYSARGSPTTSERRDSYIVPASEGAVPHTVFPAKLGSATMGCE